MSLDLSRPWGHLRFLGERQEEIVRKDEHGKEYGSGEYHPPVLDLICDCGYDFSILKSSFPGKRKMRTCGRPVCEYEQERLTKTTTASTLFGERPNPADDPRLKALGEREAKRLGAVLANAASMRERLEIEKAYLERRGKLGRPKLSVEQRGTIISVRVPIHLVESTMELAEKFKTSRNAMIVSFIKDGVRLLKKDE